jgi:hypothetical protein
VSGFRLEGGLGWFEELSKRYGKDIFSIFISPFDGAFLEEGSRNPQIALGAIVGKEIALRIHAREGKEAGARREQGEQLRKEGALDRIKLFTPTPHKEFMSRIEEAVKQVERRNEYSQVLVNKWAHTSEELDRIISDLTDNFVPMFLPA